MGLKEVGSSLPPGFRFCPNDDELVCHYLYNKVSNHHIHHQNPSCTLLEIDLHKCEPWQLPEVAKLNAEEWYFFSFRDRKYATGSRANRATTSGYWKATGKDKSVYDPRTRVIVGMRKTLVFYKSRAPNGIKTGWIMHEFRLENPNIPPKEDWVLCRVFLKSRGENKIGIDNNNSYFQNMLLNNTKVGVTNSTTYTNYDQPLYEQNTTTLLNTSFEFQTFPDQNNVVKISDIVTSKSENLYGFLFDGVSGYCLGDNMDMLDDQQQMEKMGFDVDNNSSFI